MILLLSLLIAFSSLSPADLAPASGEQATTLIGSTAPELHLKTSTGRVVPSEHYASGNRMVAVLALNVKEGRELLSKLYTLRERYPADQLKIIAVEINRKKTNIDTYKQKHQPNVPIYYGDNKELMTHYKMQYVPTIYFIDDANIVRQVVYKDGVNNLDKLAASIDTMMAQ